MVEDSTAGTADGARRLGSELGNGAPLLGGSALRGPPKRRFQVLRVLPAASCARAMRYSASARIRVSWNIRDHLL